MNTQSTPLPSLGADPVKPLELAKQQPIKVGEYELPGLAFDKDGKIAVQSLIDMLLQCMALLNHPAVNDVLKANSIMIRDMNGKILFPQPPSLS
jgi:hypothetical protein